MLKIAQKENQCINPKKWEGQYTNAIFMMIEDTLGKE